MARRSTTPLSALRELTAAEATGELICAAPELEAHVYLQRGRVAWATSSTSRYAFGRDLVRRAGIDERDFREVVETCRRERRPLGETLVEWGLTTPDQVRASLEAQVRDVMESLISLREAQTMFLERGEKYRSYATELTFALDEVVDASAAVDEHAQELLARTLEAVPDARWVEVIRAGAAVAVHESVGTHSAALAPSIAAKAFGPGVDFLTVRSGLGTLVGIASPEGDHRVLLGLGGDTRLGAISAAVASLMPAPPRLAAQTGERAPVAEGRACDPCADALWESVRSSEDIVAAQIQHPAGEPFVVHRSPAAADEAQRVARHGREVLTTKELEGELRDPGDTQVELLGFVYRSAVLGTRANWHFGAVLPDGTDRSIWLTVPRRVSQGLGWALLTATTRQLGDIRCELEASE